MERFKLTRDLLILGVHLKSEGYPNTLYRLQDLQNSNYFQITEINQPMWHESTQNKHGFSRLTRSLWKGMRAHFYVLSRYLLIKRPEQIYIPYPAVFILFFLSFLPSKLRSKHIVADVFISIYDTVVLDRKLLTKEHILAKLLKWIEKRAYLCADKLIVDTQENADYLGHLFNLSTDKLVSVPLSSNEIDFNHRTYLPKKNTCRILFVGTLVPLHGIQTILQAIEIASQHCDDIHFTLIGSGHDDSIVNQCLSTTPTKITWIKEWVTSSYIAAEIDQADICLGIFGSGKKTQRVCPFKIYAYASIGRAIITGKTNWLLNATAKLNYQPFVNVPVNNSSALALKIIQLAKKPKYRKEMAENSYQFYQTHLDNELALNQLTHNLIKTNASPLPPEL